MPYKRNNTFPVYFCPLHVAVNDISVQCKGKGKGKGKETPVQAWIGPEGSRRLRFPDFKTIST